MLLEGAETPARELVGAKEGVEMKGVGGKMTSTHRRRWEAPERNGKPF